MSESLWYPSVGDVLAIHENLVAEYQNTDSGVKDEGSIEFAIQYIRNELFNDVPNTIHGKAYQLLRLLVANHPFVDGNKRTALNTVAVFYVLNGYRFAYGEEVKDILKQFGTNEANVEKQYVLDYLRSHSERIILEETVEEWRDELLQYGLDRLSEELSDPNG